jgi:hypothetical protein
MSTISDVVNAALNAASNALDRAIGIEMYYGDSALNLRSVLSEASFGMARLACVIVPGITRT